ncbi:7-carboxy-7-deazaguanine synthase QueE [Nocardia takedensis]|uniref:7-carboxy-7-deazaguanine synthase QueE n=1 Tax=Nocardia takedensis TaxID=259390 RepID=UPI003F764745
MSTAEDAASERIPIPETVPVAELFYSFQGEGANLGRRALFARFMDCNLSCGYARRPMSADPAAGAMVCDTEYTWNAARHDLVSGTRHLTCEQIWAELRGLDPAGADSSVAPVDLLVISGGEPLLHQRAATWLAGRAGAAGMRVEIETNATIRPSAALLDDPNVWFNAGLKLGSSAVPRAKRVKPEAIRAIRDTGRARWKFVVCDELDLDEIRGLQSAFDLTEVWLSPEGTTPEIVIERMRALAEPALRHGWHLSTRQHVLIWGGERAR